MPHRVNVKRINDAIQECLRQCQESPAPLAQLLVYCEQLKAGGEWKEAEIRDVETAVRRLLQGIL